MLKNSEDIKCMHVTRLSLTHYVRRTFITYAVSLAYPQTHITVKHCLTILHSPNTHEKQKVRRPSGRIQHMMLLQLIECNVARLVPRHHVTVSRHIATSPLNERHASHNTSRDAFKQLSSSAAYCSLSLELSANETVTSMDSAFRCLRARARVCVCIPMCASPGLVCSRRSEPFAARRRAADNYTTIFSVAPRSRKILELVENLLTCVCAQYFGGKMAP